MNGKMYRCLRAVDDIKSDFEKYVQYDEYDCMDKLVQLFPKIKRITNIKKLSNL